MPRGVASRRREIARGVECARVNDGSVSRTRANRRADTRTRDRARRDRHSARARSRRDDRGVGKHLSSNDRVRAHPLSASSAFERVAFAHRRRETVERAAGPPGRWGPRTATVVIDE